MLSSGTQLRHSYFPSWVNTESRPRKIASKQAGFSFSVNTSFSKAQDQNNPALFNFNYYKFVSVSGSDSVSLQICNKHASLVGDGREFSGAMKILCYQGGVGKAQRWLKRETQDRGAWFRTRNSRLKCKVQNWSLLPVTAGAAPIGSCI